MDSLGIQVIDDRAAQHHRRIAVGDEMSGGVGDRDRTLLAELSTCHNGPDRFEAHIPTDHPVDLPSPHIRDRHRN